MLTISREKIGIVILYGVNSFAGAMISSTSPIPPPPSILRSVSLGIIRPSDMESCEKKSSVLSWTLRFITRWGWRDGVTSRLRTTLRGILGLELRLMRFFLVNSG